MSVEHAFILDAQSKHYERLCRLGRSATLLSAVADIVQLAAELKDPELTKCLRGAESRLLHLLVTTQKSIEPKT